MLSAAKASSRENEPHESGTRRHAKHYGRNWAASVGRSLIGVGVAGARTTVVRQLEGQWVRETEDGPWSSTFGRGARLASRLHPAVQQYGSAGRSSAAAEKGSPLSEDFRVLAARRLEEARALYAVSQWSGSYYLAGYANECALKAVALRSPAPPYRMGDRSAALDLYSHSLTKLVTAAGLSQAFQREFSDNARFNANWQVAKVWSEASRYDTWTQLQATELFNSTSDPADGVFQWIAGFW